MDASQYTRIRELFLAAEELPPGDQEAYLQREAGSDVDLLEEVLSLLAEHDPQAAQTEGQRVQSVTPPVVRRGQPEAAAMGPAAMGPGLTPPPQVVDSSLATPKVRDSAPAGTDRGLVTQQGALRTHASPRYNDTPRPRRKPSTIPMWAERTRKHRRRTSGWLWLAALLPTALVGFWTYRGVDTAMQRWIETKLEGAAENLSMATDRFLGDKAQLVQSWARQPMLRKSVQDLVELSRTDPSLDQMRSADQIGEIQVQLRELSGNADVKFVVWNDSFRVLASWLDDRGDVGNPVHPTGAANLARVMMGETVIYGPDRLTETTTGFTPETNAPVMAVIVPIRDDRQKIIGAMLVRGFSLYQEFNEIFARASISRRVGRLCHQSRCRHGDRKFSCQCVGHAEPI